MNNISDDIIKRGAEGNHEAFESIYRAYCKFVYNVAWRIVNTHDDAAEVTQEVFICVYRKLDSFRFQSTFKTWIYRITINTAMNYSKKNSKVKDKTTEFVEQIHSVDDLSDGERAWDKEHNERVVSALLNTLNEDQKACVVLRNIEGLSYQEIADALNINLNTVRSRLSRAREALLQLRKEVTKNEL